jgi:hypothetical protein
MHYYYYALYILPTTDHLLRLRSLVNLWFESNKSLRISTHLLVGVAPLSTTFPAASIFYRYYCSNNYLLLIKNNSKLIIIERTTTTSYTGYHFVLHSSFIEDI